jgi:carbonic anhydrase/acetyltransferase-like protein (isoleucine patch superfamily)
MVVSPRGLVVLAGIFWLALALPMFGLAALSVLIGSQSVVLFAAMAAASLVQATALLTKPTARPRMFASVVLGVLFAVVAVLASLQSGVFPPQGPTLVYGALAAFTAVISAIAASIGHR